VVDHVDRWPGPYIPGRGYRPPRTAAIPEGSPGDIFVLERLLESVAILITVDPEQGEGLICKTFYERPLVWVHGPAGRSPVAPEVEHDDLSAIVTQFKFDSVNIMAKNLWCRFTDTEISNFKQL